MTNFVNIKRVFMAVAVATMLSLGNALAQVDVTGDVTLGGTAVTPGTHVSLIGGALVIGGPGSVYSEIYEGLSLPGGLVSVTDATVGSDGNDGALILDNASIFTASGNMTVGNEGNGYVSLDGASSLSTTGWLWLSGAYAGNSMTLSNNSTLNVTDATYGLYIGGGGTNQVQFIVTNSNVNVATLNVVDNSVVNFTGTSTLNVTGDANFDGDGYSVYIQQPMTVGGDMNIAGTGEVQIVGGTTTANVTGDVNIETGATLEILNNGTLGVASGKSVYVADGGSVINEGTIQGTVEVDNGGVLKNSGTIDGMVLIEQGGQIGGIGDTPNTMTIAAGAGNDFTLYSGSTFIVNIDKTQTPQHDKIQVTSGNVVLESGSQIKVVPVDYSQLTNNETFDIIVADAGTVQGSSTIIDNSLFRHFEGQIINNNIYQLTYTSNSFAAVAQGRNNVSVAAALDNMLNSGNATPAQTTMLNNLLTFSDTASFNNALHQMNAEMYTLHGRNLPNQMESFNRFLSQHLTQMRNGNGAQLTAKADAGLGMALASADVDPETMAEVIESKKEADARGDSLTDSEASTDTSWSTWGQIINMWHKEKASSRLTGYNNYSWGAVVGTDREFAPGLRIGALIGYIRSEYHMKDSRGNLDVDTLRVGPYVDWSMGKMFVEAALTFGYHWNDAERKVNYQGFSDEDKADNYGAWDLTPYARVGYKFNVAGWDLTPSMAMQYVHYKQNGVTEHGGAAAMKIDSYETNSLRQIFLLELSKFYDLNYVKLVPAFTIGYSYDYLDTGETLGADFIGGYPCTFYPGGTSKGHVIWGASLTALLSDNLSLFVRYDGFAAGSDYSNALSSGLNYKF